MNHAFVPTARRCAALALLAGAMFSPSAIGQVAPTAATAKPADETIQLNVFEVSADRDDSYGALNSNSITRFNTELAKLPISADIYNEAFMRDINATNVEQMIAEYTAGAGFASNDAASSAEEGTTRRAARRKAWRPAIGRPTPACGFAGSRRRRCCATRS
jgi:hypothetical protein